MEQGIIKEPQLSYLLELFTELGDAADNFVLAGAQALRFMVKEPRYTKDFDFVLNVIPLRQMPPSISDLFKRLGYEAIPEAQLFQFSKKIPNSNEMMRIEFLASDKERRSKNFRVDVQKNIHARACAGAEIVLKESDLEEIKGVLPSSKYTEIKLRIIRPHALLMMKLFALDDRYQNIRGPGEAKHDRDEARIHTADIIAIVHNYITNPDFVKSFWTQFSMDEELKKRTKDILSKYFGALDNPGVLLYAESLKVEVEIDKNVELNRVIREIGFLLRAEF
jgi:hypothetical protein